MFKDRRDTVGGVDARDAFATDAAASRSDQPASLSLSHAFGLADTVSLPPPADAVTLRRSSRKPLGQRLHDWRLAASSRFQDADLAPDLALDIGSARWFRGLGTMVGLSAFAFLFWPNFDPVEAAPGTRVDSAARDEFRSQMIMPLALGADSGRRMGATAAVVPLASAPERPSIQLTATLGSGDSFGRMLQRAGVGSGDAGEIETMVAAALPLDQLTPGTRFDLTLGRRAAPDRPRPIEQLSFRARFDLDLAVERRGSQLALVRKPIQVDSTPLRIRGIVGSSLYRSARAAGAPVKAIQDYLRTLDKQIDLDSGIMASDEFDIILDYKRAASGEVEVGQLLYAGLDRGEKPRLQMLRWGRDGEFYEASGVGEARQSAGVSPVAGRVTSNYGMRRHPILGYKRMHSGVDFGARYGAPIYATGDGVIDFAGRHGGHGNYVRINHAGGLGSGYAHMSKIAVSRGSRVRRGQVIGYVGSTGLSTGPHLHYEMYRNGRTVNPGSVQFVSRAQLEGSELAAYRARLAALRNVEPGAALASLAPRQTEASPAREIDRLGDKLER